MPLDAIHAKLDRADAHREALMLEANAFLDRKPIGVHGKFERDASRYSLRIAIHEDPPLKLSIILGDMVHNLRSALDHLAWDLAIATGGEPRIGATAFPVFTEEPSGKTRQKWARMVTGISQAAVDALRKIQPYETSDRPERTGLAVLVALSNQDKHRLALARVAAIQAHDYGLIGLEEVRDINLGAANISIGRALIDGDEIAWAEAHATGREPEAQLKGELPIEIAFGDGHTRFDGLANLCNQSRSVVAHLAPFLDE